MRYAHAKLGCDTTSAIYGIGKSVALKLLQKDESFQRLANVFDKEHATKSEVQEAGEAAIVALYKGDSRVDINNLRHDKFCHKVANSSVFVHPQVLPPTAAATKYHSYRVYYQIQEWKGEILDPLKWGWKLVNDSYGKHGLDCSVACGECRDVRCANASHAQLNSKYPQSFKTIKLLR